METIWLEFKGEGGNLRAFGTEVTFHIDGRWSAMTRVAKIQERLAELREAFPAKYGDVLFVGYTSQGARNACIHSMTDPQPPRWFTSRTVESLAGDIYGPGNILAAKRISGRGV